MRYFLDTEFIERPTTIDLISIGIVAEDGREFYAESSEVDWAMASNWVMGNVWPHLQTGTEVTRAEIRDGILAFVGDDTSPKFWAYYGDYDWVVFCWLFGTMMDLPKGWPKFCRDLKQWAVDLGSPHLPKQTDGLHNALADAWWNHDTWAYLDDLGERIGRERLAGT